MGCRRVRRVSGPRRRRPTASMRPTISWPGMIGNLRIGQFAVDDMQIGAADATSRHLDADLARPGSTIGQLGPFERAPDLLQHHRMHATSFQCFGASIDCRPLETTKHARQTGQADPRPAAPGRSRRPPRHAATPLRPRRGTAPCLARAGRARCRPSTSPAPAVASVGGALALMIARPSGAAITVSLPLRTTTAPLRTGGGDACA